MMLQGHFIHTFLDPIHKDLSNEFYSVWYYFRGITAPIFFTVSGFVFTFILLKSKEKKQEKYRIIKGFKRGLQLIVIGYLIRIPVVLLIFGGFNKYYLIVDVLQCIGLSLILIIAQYLFSFKKVFYFSTITFFWGTLIFLFEPYYRNINFESIPTFLSNYISKKNGSIFTILPWFGYINFGAFIACLFYLNIDKKYFKKMIISIFLILGAILILYSSEFLMLLYQITKINLFCEVAYFNYLFSRLGDVLIFFGVVYLFENFLKKPIILKIGKNTLPIYVVHFIVLYGTTFQFGLTNIVSKNLTPLQSIIGAILFLISISIISIHYKDIFSFMSIKYKVFLSKKKKL